MGDDIILAQPIYISGALSAGLKVLIGRGFRVSAGWEGTAFAAPADDDGAVATDYTSRETDAHDNTDANLLTLADDTELTLQLINISFVGALGVAAGKGETLPYLFIVRR